MPPRPYGPPVNTLLAIGDDRRQRGEAWQDYAQDFGFGPEHVAELIRLACNSTLGDDGMDPAVWGQVHAWRALGQMRAEASLVPLLDLLRDTIDEHDDVLNEEIPTVIGMIGPPALPKLVARLFSPRSSLMFTGAIVSAIGTLAEHHPDARHDCVAVLKRLLGGTVVDDQELNGSAVSVLIDLAATETIDTIRAAFARDAVELSIAGDLEDVEIALGLRVTRDTPKPNYHADYYPPPPDDPPKLRSPKIGRNEPCPCGSGKKYKKCCLV